MDPFSFVSKMLTLGWLLSALPYSCAWVKYAEVALYFQTCSNFGRIPFKYLHIFPKFQKVYQHVVPIRWADAAACWNGHPFPHAEFLGRSLPLLAAAGEDEVSVLNKISWEGLDVGWNWNLL